MNADPRETELGVVSELLLFVTAPLDSHDLVSIPIGFINPANIREKLRFWVFLFVCVFVCCGFFWWGFLFCC